MIYFDTYDYGVQLTSKVVESYKFYNFGSDSDSWPVYEGTLSGVTTEVYTDSGWLIVGPNELSVWED
jgi:hypothetical protein